MPLFTRFDSIYQALSAFTSTVAPPLMVVIALGAVWPRFSSRAAFWSVTIGFVALVASHTFPVLVQPVSHGIPADNGDRYIWALFGLLATVIPALAITWFGPSGPTNGNEGLVWQSLGDAIRTFKGAEPTIQLPQAVVRPLAIRLGDCLHVSDDRWRLGGFRSLAMECGEPTDEGLAAVLSKAAIEHGNLRKDRAVREEKIL